MCWQVPWGPPSALWCRLYQRQYKLGAHGQVRRQPNGRWFAQCRLYMAPLCVRCWPVGGQPGNEKTGCAYGPAGSVSGSSPLYDPLHVQQRSHSADFCRARRASKLVRSALLSASRSTISASCWNNRPCSWFATSRDRTVNITYAIRILYVVCGCGSGRGAWRKISSGTKLSRMDSIISSGTPGAGMWM